MGCWGFFTALLRPLAGEGGWELLERAYNFGIPLLMLWVHGGTHGRSWFRVITEVPRFTVISAITEFERSLISERVRAGIAKARANGTRHGRPKLDQQIIQEIRRLRTEGQSLHQIARTLRISHQTVANYAPPQPKTRR
jgi:hypothetical protein